MKLQNLTNRRASSGLALAAIAAVCFAGIALATTAFRRPATAVPEAVPAPESQPVAQSTPDGLRVLRITIRPTGFDPAELTLPHGRFILAVDNRTGLRNLTFRLDREGAGRLREVRMPREQLSYREVIEPAPGVYLMTEADHPAWVCRISVAD